MQPISNLHHTFTTTLQNSSRTQQQTTDIGTYVSGTITKIRCFSRDNCKCQLCLAISALSVVTALRRILMARFTAFHTLTFISSKITQEYRLAICPATSCGLFYGLEALILRHKSHIFNAEIAWPSKGARKVAPSSYIVPSQFDSDCFTAVANWHLSFSYNTCVMQRRFSLEKQRIFVIFSLRPLQIEFLFPVGRPHPF